MAISHVAFGSDGQVAIDLVGKFELFGYPIGHDAAAQCGLLWCGAYEVNAVQYVSISIGVECHPFLLVDGQREIVGSCESIVAAHVVGFPSAYACLSVVDIAHGYCVVRYVVACANGTLQLCLGVVVLPADFGLVSRGVVQVCVAVIDV